MSSVQLFSDVPPVESADMCMRGVLSLFEKVVTEIEELGPNIKTETNLFSVTMLTSVVTVFLAAKREMNASLESGAKLPSGFKVMTKTALPSFAFSGALFALAHYGNLSSAAEVAACSLVTAGLLQHPGIRNKINPTVLKVLEVASFSVGGQLLLQASIKNKLFLVGPNTFFVAGAMIQLAGWIPTQMMLNTYRMKSAVQSSSFMSGVKKWLRV